MPLSDNPPCQAEACAIQTCLAQNSYNQEKCDGVLEKLYACCNELYKRNPKPPGMSDEEEAQKLRAGKGEKGKDFSTACPMRSVVERKCKELESKKAQS